MKRWLIVVLLAGCDGPAWTIDGTVHDADSGAPLAACAFVRCQSRSGCGELDAMDTFASTDTQGTFRLASGEGKPSVGCDLVVQSAGHTQSRTSVATICTDADFQGCCNRGRVEVKLVSNPDAGPATCD